MTEIGTVIDGKYEVLREIGRGGMSVVYLAMDTHLNKQWAVKEIRKKGSGKNDEIVVNSLLAEANMMKRLDHPSLPRIVDIIDNGVTIYVVMDYIEGESLDKILLEYGAQPEEKVINWAMQIADALAYLHSQKPPIIYRDMKPANVMLKPEGNIKIIDFGIAREYKEQNLADTTVLGTKGYAPPEQYSGQTDPRSDIFALGMTMHHLLTGVDPRNGEPYAPVRQWNPELSEGIEIIIDRCVQPASENRYQSCADLIYDLEHPELITKGFKRKQKQRLASFLVAAILSVVMLISGFVCSFASTQVNNNTYESLISVMASTSLDQKISSYKQAIEIYPYDTQAYIKILEAYENEGQFDKAENNEFLALYNRYQDGFDKTTVEYAELNYKIGMMYFNYYTENGEVKFNVTFVDVAAPVISLIEAAPNGWTNADKTVTVTASDNSDSFVVYYYFTADGEATAQEAENGSFTAARLGNYTVYAVDAANNKSVEQTIDVTQLSGSGRTVHDFRGADGRQRAELVTVEHDTVVETATVFVCHGQDLTVELLDQQRHHEVGVGVFFWENDKHRTLGRAEFLRIDGSIETQDLFQLRVQERI